jgi:hypothetical protein
MKITVSYFRQFERLVRAQHYVDKRSPTAG